MTVESLARKILDTTEQFGGASFTLEGENLAGSFGYAVSTFPGRERVIPSADLTLGDVVDFIILNHDTYQRGGFIGTWQHEGKTYLDISQLVPDYDTAVKLGQEHKQLAIFDLTTMEEIAIPQGVAA